MMINQNNMSEDILLSVDHVSKKFCRSLKRSLWYGIQDIGNELTGRRNSSELRRNEFWAVDDLSFELRRGECLGLIGPNGAGKSTLLKMINGLIKPDKGSITIRGRVGAIIELGTGFNPILTGRENIYNNGVVLGFTKREIDKKFDDIVGFSEIGDFIDTPVQNYSSGMKVRLGFAVASQMEPDVLLIDEVLAVGDAQFRIKCYNLIYELLNKCTIVFVSHSIAQIAKVTNRVLLLRNGRTEIISYNLAEVFDAYFSFIKGGKLSVEGNQLAQMLSFSFGNENNMATVGLSPDSSYEKGSIDVDVIEPVVAECLVKVDPLVENFNLILFISDIDQKIVAQSDLRDKPIHNSKGVQKIRILIPGLLLNSGKYSLSFQMYKTGITERADIIYGVRNIIEFKVVRDRYIGVAPVIYETKFIIDKFEGRFSNYDNNIIPLT